MFKEEKDKEDLDFQNKSDFVIDNMFKAGEDLRYKELIKLRFLKDY